MRIKFETFGEFAKRPGGLGLMIGLGLAFVLLIATLILPSPVPGSWPGWAQAVSGVAYGTVLALIAMFIGAEVERFVKIKRDYDAAQRDIERMERGDR